MVVATEAVPPATFLSSLMMEPDATKAEQVEASMRLLLDAHVAQEARAARVEATA